MLSGKKNGTCLATWIPFKNQPKSLLLGFRSLSEPNAAELAVSQPPPQKKKRPPNTPNGCEVPSLHVGVGWIGVGGWVGGWEDWKMSGFLCRSCEARPFRSHSMNHLHISEPMELTNKIATAKWGALFTLLIPNNTPRIVSGMHLIRLLPIFGEPS